MLTCDFHSKQNCRITKTKLFNTHSFIKSHKTYDNFSTVLYLCRICNFVTVKKCYKNEKLKEKIELLTCPARFRFSC